MTHLLTQHEYVPVDDASWTPPPHTMHWSHPFRFVLGLKVLAVKAILARLKGLYWTVYAQTWDLYLNIDNWFSPKSDPRNVIPPGAPGFMGE